VLKTCVIGLFALGAALFGTALYVQTSPLAFTRAETAIDDSGEPVRIEQSPKAVITEPDVAEATADPEATRPVELPPLRVEAAAPAVRAPKARRELEPCSNWQELGPAHVVDGVGLDQRRVRNLC
jgi:hypothetical protein